MNGEPASGVFGCADPAGVETLADLAQAFQRIRGARSYADLDKAVRPKRLPQSTLSSMLNGKAVPIHETVVTFLTACGLDQDAREPWLAAWERVATAHLPRPAGGTRVSDARARLLGVHASIQIEPGATDLPIYVPRDLDADLHTAVTAAAQQGGFVLLVGGSSVGKTRALVEAVKAVLPEWWLIHPADVGVLHALAADRTRRTVVWLDELQRYLAHPAGLPLGVVRGLITAGAVVVATMWPDEYAVRVAPRLLGQSDPYANDREVLRLAQVIRVPDIFSQDERLRAEHLASDRRIQIALSTSDSGFTQVLAAGPALIDWWENARHYRWYGYAVITAALDARRVGAQAPVTRDFLCAAAAGYLTSVQQATAPIDWLDQALIYATTPLHGAAAALSPVPAGMGQVAGYTVADYLHQHAHRTRRTTPLPDVVWQALVAHHRRPEDALRLAEAATNRALHQHAESLYRMAADFAAPRGLTGLAELRMEQGNRAEAFALWREAALAGDFAAWRRMVHVLERKKYIDEALTVLREAEVAGLDGALNWRAHLLNQAGRVEEAESIWRLAIANGDPEARIGLAELLQELGRPDEAEQVWQREIESGMPNSRSGLAGLFRQQGRIDEAIIALQDGLAAGDDPYAWSWLADLLEIQGRVDEAIAAGCEAINLGEDINAWSRMTGIFIKHDRIDEGLDLAVEGLEMGHDEAAEVLAGLLRSQGRIEEAISVWTERIADGDLYARGHLARLLLEEQRSNEAERVLRESVAARDPYAYSGLARLLQDQGRIDEAIMAWLEAVAEGSPNAALHLCKLLAEQERAEEAEQIWRQEITAGNPTARGWLAHLLKGEGRLGEATDLRRHGLNADGSSA